jgi:NADH-quinone oxidoreductase subunit M
MYQRVIFGPVTHEENRALADLSPREITIFAPILALVFFMGVYPQPLLTRMEPSITAIVAHVEKRAKSAGPAPIETVTEAKAADPRPARAL